MTTRRVNMILWLCAATLIIGAIAAPVAAWFLPVEQADARAARARPREKPANANPALPSLEGFEPVWNAPLRRPLMDAPPQARQAEAMVSSDAAGLPVTLVGTVGSSLAMLRAADGSVDVRGAGEAVGGVEVVAVRPGEADVRFNGQLVRLQMPKEAATTTTTTTNP